MDNFSSENAVLDEATQRLLRDLGVRASGGLSVSPYPYDPGSGMPNYGDTRVQPAVPVVGIVPPGGSWDSAAGQVAPGQARTLFGAAPDTPVVVQTQPPRDPTGTTTLPVSSVADPLAWARSMVATPPVQKGVGLSVASAAPVAVPGAVGVAASDYDKKSQDILDAARKQRDLGNSQVINVLTNLPADPTISRQDIYNKLEASTPKPQIEQRKGWDELFARVRAAYGPDGRVSPSSMNAYLTHTEEKDKDRLNLALQQREEKILRQVGFSSADIADMQKANERKNKIAVEVAQLQNPYDPHLTTGALSAATAGGHMAQSTEQFNVNKQMHVQDQAALDRRHQETLRQQAALHETPESRARAVQMQVAQGMLASKDSPLYISPEEGKRILQGGLYGLKEPKAITPMNEGHIKLIDDTAQSLIGTRMNTPQGKELYTKFRMALSNPQTQDQALPALYSDIRNFK